MIHVFFISLDKSNFTDALQKLSDSWTNTGQVHYVFQKHLAQLNKNLTLFFQKRKQNY